MYSTQMIFGSCDKSSRFHSQLDQSDLIPGRLMAAIYPNHVWNKASWCMMDNPLYTEGRCLTWVICPVLTHWGRVTHICFGNLINISLVNGLSPAQCQVIIWTNAEIVLIETNLGTNFSKTFIEIHTFSFRKMYLKMSSAKWRSFVLSWMC